MLSHRYPASLPPDPRLLPCPLPSFGPPDNVLAQGTPFATAEDYTAATLSHHKVMVCAMKAKQSVDIAAAETLEVRHGAHRPTLFSRQQCTQMLPHAGSSPWWAFAEQRTPARSVDGTLTLAALLYTL